jgi:hypothetical protein
MRLRWMEENLELHSSHNVKNFMFRIAKNAVFG